MCTLLEIYSALNVSNWQKNFYFPDLIFPVFEIDTLAWWNIYNQTSEATTVATI